VTQSPASKTNAISVVMIDRLPKGKIRETWWRKVMGLKSQNYFFVVMTARLPKSKSGMLPMAARPVDDKSSDTLVVASG
jgi:hypothetical protein